MQKMYRSYCLMKLPWNKNINILYALRICAKECIMHTSINETYAYIIRVYIFETKRNI